MKVLIVYGSTHGQTRKISEYMQSVLREAGHEVQVTEVSANPPAPAAFDAIMIGASIHVQKYQPPVVKYIAKHLDQLNAMPSAFFSVCMAIASVNETERIAAQNIAADFLKNAGWNPMRISVIAGAVQYSKYGFITKWIMKRIARKEGGSTDTSRDHEYTDWSQVKKFAEEFAASVKLPGVNKKHTNEHHA